MPRRFDEIWCLGLFLLAFCEPSGALTSDDKIVGGRVATNIPFIVSIQVNRAHMCGGTLITLVHVQTACHCVCEYVEKLGNPTILVPEMSKSEEYRLSAGDWDLGVNTYRSQIRPVKKLLAHPRCIKLFGIIQWDFGLIVATNKFKKTTFVAPTALLSLDKHIFGRQINNMIQSSRVCWVMGWGQPRKDEGQPRASPRSRFLRAVKMKLITDQECRFFLSQQNFRYLNYSFSERAQMCAVGVKWTDSDCTGDSGGPVYCGGYVVASVSYGFECGRGDLPAVYAKLSEFVSFFANFSKQGKLRNSSANLKACMLFLVLAVAISHAANARNRIYLMTAVLKSRQ